MENGELTSPLPSLIETQAFAKSQLACLIQPLSGSPIQLRFQLSYLLSCQNSRANS
jgi:hypothetical protein